MRYRTCYLSNLNTLGSAFAQTQGNEHGRLDAWRKTISAKMALNGCLIFSVLFQGCQFRAIGLQRRAEIPDLDALHQGPNKGFE